MFVLLIFTVSCPLSQFAAPHVSGEEETVVLEVQFGKDKKKRFEKIPFREKMTVQDVMNHAKKVGKLKYLFRGKKVTAFLTEIDGVKNQGAKGDNWIFRINGKLGKKSFGVAEIQAGDQVTWTFGKYKP